MKTKKLKRALGILLTLAMCLTLLPNVAFAEETNYYVVGSMSDWAVNEDYIMTKTTGEATEYMLSLPLSTTSQFKIVGVTGGVKTWYPDGMGNSYGDNGEITANGNYDVYFRPNADGGDDWFYNYIYVTPSTPADTYIVAGDCFSWGSWDATAEEGKLTKGVDGKYRGTFTATEANDSAQFMVVKNGDVWIGDQNGNNVTFVITGPGEFTITLDPATNEITVTGDNVITAFYDLYVGGVQVTSANAADVFGDGTVSYEADTNTLTLNNATVNGSYENSAIYSSLTETLTITANGDSTVTEPIVAQNSCGIRTAGDLALNGTGSLNIIGGTSTNYGDTVYGLWIGGNLTIGGSLTLDVEAVGESQYGQMRCGCRLDGTTLTMKDDAEATFYAQGDSRYAAGIWCFSESGLTLATADWTGSLTTKGNGLAMRGYDGNTFSHDADTCDMTGFSDIDGTDGYLLTEDPYTLHTGHYSGGYGQLSHLKYVFTPHTETPPTINAVAFTVNNIPKGGEKVATIGNNVDITYDSDKYMIIPDQYAESVSDSENFNWFEGTFETGQFYYGSALIIPAEGETLADDLSFSDPASSRTILKVEPVYTADDQPTGEVRVYFSVLIRAHAEVIDTVSFTGVTLPEDGDDYYDIDLADGEHYTVDDVYWVDEEDEFPDTFEAGKDYYLVVSLKPERGYIFADSLTASINGGDTQTIAPDDVLGWTEISIKVPVKAIVTHTITFNANGGTVTTASDTTGADGKLTSLPTPTYSGYTFNGWYTLATGGEKVTGDTVFDADTEIFAQWTKKGGGGGGSTSYSVTAAKADNGTVETSPKSASSGSTVTVTVTPDEGYKLDTITVTDSNGRKIEVTEKDGKYTFIMPSGKAEVTPTFVKDDGTDTVDTDTDNKDNQDNQGTDTDTADKGSKFIDVLDSDYFFEPVLWAVDNKITSGTSDNTFSPDKSCTRAETVTFLWRAAGSPEAETTENPFTDINKDDYFYTAVLWAYENGITLGTSDTEFSPYDTVTRAQTVTFLYCLAGEETDGENPFTDVNDDDYYYDSVMWAYHNNVTGGTSDTGFSPADDCLRSQIVTFLYRCYK